MRATLSEALAHLGRPRLRALGLALFVTYAFFLGRPAWNQNSRFALTRALVEQQSPIIDDWHATTGDKSKRDGHFYSDKAPGLSVLGTLPYAAFYALRRAGGASLPDVRVMPLDPVDLAAERAPPPDRMKAGDRIQYNRAWRIATYLCRIFSVTLLSLLGAASFFCLVFMLARERREDGETHPDGDALRVATAATAIYALATPAFAYSVGLYGHQPAAALLIAATALIYGYEPGTTRSWGQLNLLAVCMGLAVCVEYPTALPVAGLGVWVGLRFGLREMLRLALLGLPWLLALLAYHAWAFGSPFATGYDFVYLEEFAEGMEVRYGIGTPQPEALFGITFGSHRGLFSTSPVLLLAVWGMWRMRAHTLVRVAAAVTIYYLALNSGYYMWDGGAAVGPRHCVPALPFLGLGLVAVLRAIPQATFALASVSGLQMLLVAYAGPEAPGWGHPIWGYAFAEFAHFKGATSSTASNLGRVAGLPGPLSLIPLGLAWIAIVGFNARFSRLSVIQDTSGS